MGFGGSQKVTQTNKVELTPEQKELQKMALGQIRPLFEGGNNIQLPSLPGFDPLQTAGQENVLASVGEGGSISNLTNALGSANSFLLGDVLDINKNPALQRTIDAAIRPLTENFQSVVMPGLRTSAISAGALGDPKQRQSAQIAANQYQRQVGDTAANITTDAYGRGLEAMTRGVALAPQTQSALAFPGSIMEGIGAQRRQLEQQQGEREFAQQTLPLSLGTQLMNLSAGAPGGGSTSTVSPASGGGWTQALGAGLSAISLLAGIPGLF